MTDAPTALDKRDPLQEMLDLQVRFQSRLAHFNGATSDTQKMIDNAMMLLMEAAEVMDVLPWKKHKLEFGRKLTDIERDHLAEELVDVLHFVMNLFIVLDITESAEVFSIFLEKNNLNHRRQDGGY